MATYTRRWIPTYAPSTDLGDWKDLYKELNSDLLTAGLVSADDEGALDLDDVTGLPSLDNYAGYRLFAFNDELQEDAPVIIKLEYGVGRITTTPNAGNSANDKYPRLRMSVIFNGHASTTWKCPVASNTHSNSPANTQAFIPGDSFITVSPERGFFGLVAGADAYYSTYSTSSSMRGAVAAFFVGRTCDESGLPTDEGVVIFGPDLAAEGSAILNHWGNGNYEPMKGQYISADGSVSLIEKNWGSRIGGVSNTMVDGDRIVQNVFYQAPEIRTFPWLVSYKNTDMLIGTEFSLDLFAGGSTNFIALGNRISVGVDAASGNMAALAMVFG